MSAAALDASARLLKGLVVKPGFGTRLLMGILAAVVGRSVWGEAMKLNRQAAARNGNARMSVKALRAREIQSYAFDAAIWGVASIGSKAETSLGLRAYTLPLGAMKT